MDKGCDTCAYKDEWNGECRKGLADQFEVRSCDTSECEGYKPDPFYVQLEQERKEGVMEYTDHVNMELPAIHNALDAKQAELDGRTKALDWTANRCDELALEAGLTKIELDKAKDLIKRIKDKLKTWCGLIPWANDFIAEANEILGDVTNK